LAREFRPALSFVIARRAKRAEAISLAHPRADASAGEGPKPKA
jgi:hypothetical protein